MAIYREDIVTTDLNGESLHRSFLSYSIGSGDDDANRFGVKVYRDGVPVDLTGVSCAGYFYKADGTMVSLTGTVSGNIAYVTLTDACYTVSGKFSLAIKLSQSGVMVTVRIVDGVVVTTSM